MKVFVVHYKKLTERKEHMVRQFEKYNITDYEFIEIDRDEVQNHDLSIFHQNPNMDNCGMAVALSHIYAYNEIRLKYENGLIFEDDVILSENFMEKYTKYIEQLPEDYDMLFIGDGCNLHISISKLVPNKYIYKKSVYPVADEIDGTGRCVDSYLVSKKGAIKICDYINKKTIKL